MLHAHDWRFAKTMPQFPHWYTLRKNWTGPEDFEAVVQFIRDHGYRKRWGKYNLHYLDINGFKYWSMGAPLGATILINRAETDAEQPYDALAGAYDDLFRTPEALAEDATVIATLDYQGGSILDVGCGTGLLLDYLKPEKYLGIDPSRAMIKRLLEKHELTDALPTSLRGFWPNGQQYDLATALYGTASYLTDAELERIPALLAPGGRYFLMSYAPGYTPKTHEAGAILAPIHRHGFQTSPLSGRETRMGNYMVLTGPK